MGWILVFDPAVLLAIWMAKARFLARPFPTLKVPGYTLKIMFQKYLKPRGNETQQGKKKKQEETAGTKHNTQVKYKQMSQYYMFS